MITNRHLSFALVFGAIALCVAVMAACLVPILRTAGPRCLPPPAVFSEATLVGTWEAGVPRHRDTLTIRADGTYSQRIHVEFPEGPPLDYQTDALPWYLSYSSEGIPYLHLTGYSFCGMNVAIPCTETDGDGHDVCRNERIEMNGEGILLVLATSDAWPTLEEPVYYYLHYPLGSENSYVYARSDNAEAP